MAEAEFRVPRLIVFTDTTRIEQSTLLARLAELGLRARSFSVLFTLRDYQLSARARWELGISMSALAARTRQRFGLADRADLARALSCSAFHLPESGLSARDARGFLGTSAFLSQACHDLSSEAAPELDARLVSPIFEARKGRPALGLSALKQAIEVAPAGPASFALGGIGPDNAAACITAGAAGVAVIGAALAPDPAPLLESLGILRC